MYTVNSYSLVYFWALVTESSRRSFACRSPAGSRCQLRACRTRSKATSSHSYSFPSYSPLTLYPSPDATANVGCHACLAQARGRRRQGPIRVGGGCAREHTGAAAERCSVWRGKYLLALPQRFRGGTSRDARGGRGRLRIRLLGTASPNSFADAISSSGSFLHPLLRMTSPSSEPPCGASPSV